MSVFINAVRNELYKTIRRPRSYIGFGIISFVCLMLQAAFYHDGSEILKMVTTQFESLFDVQGKLLNGNLICFIILQTLI
ncbi:MAG TPA: hypothetical protein PLP34_09590, partial [Chitinophagaceae bacterium]|nr:hypothetical protein [Chitinophagaceae bacterium]